MGLDPPVRIVAGVGFRHGTHADEIEALIRRALAEAGLEASALAGIATAADRAGAAALAEAAARFGLGPRGIAAEALAEADVRVVTRSARIETARGIGSVAEAAALAAGGPEARLALPRITSAGATCALAAVADGAAPVQEGP
ncbi:cobalamin biosynthesis protein [Methylobacterium symbioticum]